MVQSFPYVKNGANFCHSETVRDKTPTNSGLEKMVEQTQKQLPGLLFGIQNTKTQGIKWVGKPNQIRNWKHLNQQLHKKCVKYDVFV